MKKNSNTQNANAKSNNAKAEAKKVRYQSENGFVLTGRLVEDAKSDGEKFARFRIAHNFGKDMDAMFTDIVAFAKNGKKKVDVPFDILTKGTCVRVSGYMRPNNHEYNGKKYYATDFVALTIEPAQVKEDDDAEGEEE